MKVIPAIDLIEGRCVRLLRGEFDRQTIYGDDPVALARDYELTGFDCLHVVDLDGARSGRQHNDTVVRGIVDASGIAIQLGGGIREESQVESWLDAGVNRVVIGSVAVGDATRVRGWLARYGADRIVLALDVTTAAGAPPQLVTHGWTRQAEMTLWECIDAYLAAGLEHLLCTDVARDGALTGPNLKLYAEVLERYPHVRLQASGGVRDIGDLRELEKLGVAAAITGRALLDGRITAGELQSFLPAA